MRSVRLLPRSTRVKCTSLLRPGKVRLPITLAATLATTIYSPTSAGNASVFSESRQSSYNTYSVTTFSAGISGAPTDITAGPDGNLWFTEIGKIGRITPTGTATEFPLPSAGESPTAIAAGPDGNLWFIESGTGGGSLTDTTYTGGRVGRITPQGVVTEFPLPSTDSQPTGITTGPDGNIWFSNASECQLQPTPTCSDYIGRMTPGGALTNLPGAPNQDATDITTGTDGNLWLSDYISSVIYRMTPSGAITQYNVPVASDCGGLALPYGTYQVATGPDGNVWFTTAQDCSAGQNWYLGSITPDGTVSLYPEASNGDYARLQDLVLGTDGNLWVAVTVGGSPPYGSIIDRVTINGVDMAPTLTLPGGHGVAPVALAEGPDGNLWFTQSTADQYTAGSGGYKIGRINLRPEVPVWKLRAQITRHDVGNGSVTVSWKLKKAAGAPSIPITSYVVTATAAGNDRAPSPIAPPVPISVPGNAHTATVRHLIEDCHQRYTVSVTPETRAGAGTPGVSTAFRPSGFVARGQPRYVVILLDGIGESKAGFTMNPYDPTNRGEMPSYCPENVDKAGRPVNNDFPHEPHGPWEFFRKWNFYDPSDTNNNNNPVTSSNSTPRNLGPTMYNVSNGGETHEFMLDAIAARGAIVLPFSYNAATVTGGASHPSFTFMAYSNCNSTPVFAGPGCDRNPGGNPDPPSAIRSQSWTIQHDEYALAHEVHTARSVWPHAKIVILGHSQGGLIAFDAWRDGLLPGVAYLLSLDSPINGVCPSRDPFTHHCVGVPGYPEYDSRVARDRGYFQQDHSGVFRFIGTYGDSVYANVPVIGGPAYGDGNETLQHQLLVKGDSCGNSAGANADCPDPPDHISECDIPSMGWIFDDQHFIVKFCPGNVAYFNQVLGLSY